jgi:hypothetical protein
VKQFEKHLFFAMTPEEFSLSHHAIKLELELYRRVGRTFQDLFEQIMQKSDSSFLMVKPMGREGDWKADGFSLNTGTVFQCYAPEELTGSEAAKKVIEDFAGGRDHWKDKMRAWIFVWSSDRALPPQVVNVLAELKSNHPNVAINHMGREGLWQVVKQLPLVDRITILGPVPDLSAVPATTAAEIQVLMKHLGKQTASLPDDASFDLTAIADKLARNRLSAAVTNTVRPAMPVARLVREYVTKMPDPSFSEFIAMDLASKYRELSESADDPDVIFGGLVDYVLGEQRVDPKFFWAAAGIVAHYFELCDVFER